MQILILCGLLGLTGCAQRPTEAGSKAPPAPPEWKAFTHEGGGYSVLLPGQPVEKSTPLTTRTVGEAGGKIISSEQRRGAVLFSVVELPDQRSYAVGYTDFSGVPGFNWVDKSRMLHTLSDSLATNLKGTITSRSVGGGFAEAELPQPVELLGGLTCIIEQSGADGQRFQCRMYAHRLRFHLVIAGAPKRTPAPAEEVDRFFRSFRLAKVAE